jgi:hypothetical protein
MKLKSKTAAILVVSCAALAGAKTLTTDPLTGLPLLPATSSPLGNEPTRIPDSQVCKSKMQSEFYSVFNSKVSVTLNWYASRLTGLTAKTQKPTPFRTRGFNRGFLKRRSSA